MSRSAERLDEKVEDINTLYRQARALTKQGQRILSTDELSGVQALERKLLRRGSFTSVADLPKCWRSSSTTIAPWPGRSNGPTKARRWPPNRRHIYAKVH